MGERLLVGLRVLAAGSDRIEAVRGLGLMVGLELAGPEVAARLEQACFERGLLVPGAGDSAVRLSPPLVVDERRIERALAVLGDAFAA